MAKPTSKNTNRDAGFYGGLLTALAIVHGHGEDTIYEEIVQTLSEESLSELIEHAKTNDELVWSGLSDYLEKLNDG